MNKSSGLKSDLMTSVKCSIILPQRIYDILANKKKEEDFSSIKEVICDYISKSLDEKDILSNAERLKLTSLLINYFSIFDDSSLFQLFYIRKIVSNYIIAELKDTLSQALDYSPLEFTLKERNTLLDVVIFSKGICMDIFNRALKDEEIQKKLANGQELYLTEVKELFDNKKNFRGK